MAACGSSGSGSSGNARTLLQETFSGSHTVRSGVLGFQLSLTPSGSSTVKTPIAFGFGGPFQSRGSGNLPASDFNLSIDALGHHGQLGLVSTGTNGFLVLDGNAYKLPQSDYQKLASSFSSAGGGAGTGGLSRLGINPLHWLQNPSVVGTETVGGAQTTHIRSRVNVNALLGDLNTFLQKASSKAGSTSTSLPTGLSAATRQKIVRAVHNATVDVWTGSSDKTLRKLTLNLSFPVTGQFSTLFGGLNSAALGLTLQYAHLNQPQRITGPTHVKPFSGFVTKFQGVMSQLRGTFGVSAGSASGTSPSGPTTGGNSATIGRYSNCLKQAGKDVAQMQKCASLLNGG